MKYLCTIALMASLVCFSCKDAPERPDPLLNENYQPSQPPATPVSTGTTNTNTGDVVYHYVCPNNCGGGDAAGSCPVCGAAYTHNQAWHNQPQNANPQTPTTPTNPTITTSGTPPATPATPATPEPAQNAKGVWHYTCPNGCDGGAGSAIACAGCGATLSHNSLYHQ